MTARLVLLSLLLAIALAAIGLCRTACPALSAQPIPVADKQSTSTTVERPAYLNPLGVAVDHQGDFAYVALSGADSVAVVDLRERAVVRHIPTGRRPREIALS